MLLSIYLLFIVSVANICDAYKFLVVFPIPGKSHAILGEGLLKHLLNAGHEVTYITAIVVKNPPPNLRQIDVSSHFDVSSIDELMEMKNFLNKATAITDTASVISIMGVFANITVSHEAVQKLMHDPKEQFDAVIAEWMYSEIYSGLASVFNCPLIWSSSMEPHTMVMSLMDEDSNPTYSTDILSSDVPPYSFWQRISKLYFLLELKYIKWSRRNIDREIYNEGYRSAVAKRGRVLPPLDEAKYNGSLMLGNSHVSIGQAVRLPQSYIPIAGYHIEDKLDPLSPELQKLMDDAKHGVIYYSMGTMVRSKSMPEEIKRAVLEMFSGLKQTIIWKFEEKLDNLPKNVHVVHWAPQQSILAHKNCILFITHGGLLSTTEAIYYGVPIIGIPMFADQFVNVNRASTKGFAKRIDLDFNLHMNLKEAIQQMLENPRYREKAKELSLVYHDRPVSPGAELVHWVQHVVRTRGAPHLRSPALQLPLYQKLYLDFLALIFAIVIIVIKLFKHFFKLMKKDNVKMKRS